MTPAPSVAKTSGVVIPHEPRWYQRVGGLLIYSLIRAVELTIRYRWNDQSGYFKPPLPGAVIYCLWHNRLVLSLTAYYRYMRRRNPTAGVAAMVSASKDGAFLAAILECFRVQPVRGSSSRRGPQALSELTTWAERGYDLAITPDGPRGPCYQLQDGVISLAKLTGLPIMPFSYVLNWKLRLKSWDRFQIPLPFARCEVRLGKPMRVPRDASESERESLRQQLEKTLREMSPD
ncbi:MAG: hypothetical protein C5B50_16725 [Verrucomicrobia bacterium]|nr:MAG: hypothetical protein C5B50_16725 [Verrucomicrobiota bacterium]